MRRRAKRGVNDSESTGKIGQEIPVDQPAPLQPMYPEDQRKKASEAAAAVEPIVNEEPEPVEVAPPDEEENAPVESPEPAIPERKLVVETQPESPSIPPPELPSAQKDLKGYVVLAIGLPGSGKTTWFKRRGVTPLSSDMLRTILFDDITEQRYQGLVFSTLRSLLRARLIAKMPWNYVDATNLSAHERRQWIKMAKSFGYEAQAVFFDVPLEVCMERNSRRERTVSDDVMRKMAERLRPPSFKEGFSKITMVRVKGAPPVKLDGVEPEPPSS
jgi:predicted kinase